MEANKTEKAMNILILRGIEDPRLRYIVAKKLVAMFPDTPFSDWKAKIEAGDSIVLSRSEDISGLSGIKKEFEDLEAPVEVVQQQSIGGKPVF